MAADDLRKSQQKNIDAWAARPIVLEQGCEISTWDRKCGAGVVGTVVGKSFLPEGLTVKVKSYKGLPNCTNVLSPGCLVVVAPSVSYIITKTAEDCRKFANKKGA